MKYIRILCFLLLSEMHVFGQFRVDAGQDTTICCCSNIDSVKLGENRVVIGGVEPYSYTWSGKLLLASSPENVWIYASNILDDTTKSNPTLKNLYLLEEPIIFHLKVEDATGEIGYDSVRIYNSTFFVKSIYILPDTIIRGDSINLIGDPYFINNFLPLVYYLSPSHGLTDTTDIYGWAKPDTSVTYYLQAVNSVGCVSEKIRYWEIEVIDTTTNVTQDLSIVTHNLQFYPNPAESFISVSNPNNIKIKKTELFDFSGRIVQIWDATECTGNTLNIQQITPGIYLLKAETDAGVKTEKLVVQ